MDAPGIGRDSHRRWDGAENPVTYRKVVLNPNRNGVRDDLTPGIAAPLAAAYIQEFCAADGPYLAAAMHL